MNDQDRLARRFHEGLCLAASADENGASEAFLECVVADPGSGEFAQEFLATLARRFSPDQQSPSPPRELEESIKRAAGQGSWAEVFSTGPRLLMKHGWHVPTLLALAQACEAQGHGEAEAHYLRAAVQVAENVVEVQREAGKALARLRKYDEAVACWRRVELCDHGDEEAARMIATLTVTRSRQTAGLQQPDEPQQVSTRGSRATQGRKAVTRFVIGHVAPAAPATARASELSLTPIQQLEAAIRERPSIADLYLQLAQAYLDKDRDYDAERLLAKGREATDRDARVQQMWEEVTMLRHRRRVAIAEQEVRTADNPQSRASLAQATKERDRVEMEIFLGRCKREPDSAQNHYELGLRLKRADKLREACHHFEKALAGAEVRGVAALELGRALESLGQLPQALAHFRLATEAAASAGQFDEQSDAFYEAGKLTLRLKLAKLAQRYLVQLLRLDPGHREAAVLMQRT